MVAIRYLVLPKGTRHCTLLIASWPLPRKGNASCSSYCRRKVGTAANITSSFLATISYTYLSFFVYAVYKMRELNL